MIKSITTLSLKGVFFYLLLLVALFSNLQIAEASTTNNQNEQRLILINQLIEQVEKIQQQLAELKGEELRNKETETEFTTKPSITIKTPTEGQIIHSGSLITQYIEWEYNAFPDRAGGLYVKERVYNSKTKKWGPWVTIERYKDFLGKTSTSWNPAQPLVASKAQIQVGLLSTNYKYWLAKDIVEYTTLPTIR